MNLRFLLVLLHCGFPSALVGGKREEGSCAWLLVKFNARIVEYSRSASKRYGGAVLRDDSGDASRYGDERQAIRDERVNRSNSASPAIL